MGKPWVRVLYPCTIAAHLRIPHLILGNRDCADLRLTRADLRALHADAVDDQASMLEDDQDFEEQTRHHDRAERQHLAALDDLGLQDGDEALQYALMLSMEEQGGDGELERAYDDHDQIDYDR